MDAKYHIQNYRYSSHCFSVGLHLVRVARYRHLFGFRDFEVFLLLTGFIDESDCWSPEDDEISQQYSGLGRRTACDTISMMSLDSCDSRDLVSARGAADIRRRLSETVNAPKTGFKRDPDDPSAAALKEPWSDKVSGL